MAATYGIRSHDARMYGELVCLSVYSLVCNCSPHLSRSARLIAEDDWWLDQFLIATENLTHPLNAIWWHWRDDFCAYDMWVQWHWKDELNFRWHWGNLLDGIQECKTNSDITRNGKIRLVDLANKSWATGAENTNVKNPEHLNCASSSHDLIGRRKWEMFNVQSNNNTDSAKSASNKCCPDVSAR